MRRFLKSFSYAGQGLWHAVQHERNFRFHLCAAFYVIIFSFFYAFSALEYGLLAVLIAAVLTSELFNSALERVVDDLCPQKSPTAGAIKDLAAAAVLVVAIAAAVVGVLLFWSPAIFRQMGAYLLNNPLWLVLFIASLAFSVWFIFFFKRNERR